MTHQQLIDEYTSLPDEAQRQVADFVAFLRQRHKTVQSVQQSPVTGLENEAFIGMWRDHPDLKESTAWVRRTRTEEWGEGA
jgi:hypothetical protein